MRLLPMALLVGPALVVLSGSLRASTLDEILVRVYLESPRLAGARARLRAVDEGVPQALGGWRPRLSATSGAAFAQTSTDDGEQTLGTLRQVVSLVQPVYSGGATTAETSRAENEVLAERARLSAAEQEVLVEAVDAFTAVTRDRAVLELAQRNERRLAEQLTGTSDRYRFGELTRTDVAQAQTRLARGTADRVRAEGELAMSVARYRRIVGSDPDELTAPDTAPGKPFAIAEAPALAEATPAVMAARHALESARDQVDVAVAQTKPKLSLDGQAGYEREPSTLIDYQRGFTVGATLSIPLYQGGGEYARIRQARQTVTERRYALDQAHRLAEEDLIAADVALRTVEARIRSLESQVDSATAALDGVRQEALVGARTVLDVLDAEQELFAAEVELTRARREAFLAGYRMLAARGELGVASLGLEVEPYDPEGHYREVRDKWYGLGEDRSQ
ncbi:MAG TPA: TolC family outer membrane protein [Geminicoccaceae bacterium]|nr:TolC family outer membrane protein [Geminicoccus sp.]HMU49285.1 TolC family outer membrane protein [Geminicoccaceae bacterium]